MTCELVSAGRAATAAASVAYSPDVVVPARTIFAPDGGVVREDGGESASDAHASARAEKMRRSIAMAEQMVSGGIG
jgi:hypothetical protein